MSTSLPIDTSQISTKMTPAILASFLFHLALIIVGTLGLPYIKKPIEPPTPISVEIIELGEMTQTTKLAKAPEPILEPLEPLEKPKDERPPAPPKVDLKEPPKVIEPKPKEIKTDIKPKVKPAPPPPKKAEKPEPKKEEIIEEPQQTIDDVLRKLTVNLEDNEVAPAAGEVSSELEVANDAPLGPQMTTHELQALSDGFRKCFKIPIGAEGMHEMVADIRIWIDTAGNVTRAEFDDVWRVQSDPKFRVLAESGRRAALDPNCSPVNLPLEKRDIWKDKYIIVPFDPRALL